MNREDIVIGIRTGDAVPWSWETAFDPHSLRSKDPNFTHKRFVATEFHDIKPRRAGGAGGSRRDLAATADRFTIEVAPMTCSIAQLEANRKKTRWTMLQTAP